MTVTYGWKEKDLLVQTFELLFNRIILIVFLFLEWCCVRLKLLYTPLGILKHRETWKIDTSMMDLGKWANSAQWIPKDTSLPPGFTSHLQKYWKSRDIKIQHCDAIFTCNGGDMEILNSFDGIQFDELLEVRSKQAEALQLGDEILCDWPRESQSIISTNHSRIERHTYKYLDPTHRSSQTSLRCSP